MRKNVGELDAYCRIAGGLTLLGIGIMGCSKTLSLLGSLKVAEGVTRFCPMLYLLDKDTMDWDNKLKKQIEVLTEVPIEE
ncbi:MAG TPA: hypothetical protein DIW17_13480 [Clostridiales bacterium]|nr:DUF2892 domain-containing protein [Clostridia bacterium]HCS74872.1 hypothetical protein [Clostridiales bacterium]